MILLFKKESHIFNQISTEPKQYEYIENIILKDNVVRRKVFEKMLEKGLIYKNSSDNVYELNDSNLESYGINWSDLKSLKFNDKLLEFLR